MVQTRYLVRKADVDDIATVTELLQASYPILMKSAYDSAMLVPALELMTRGNPKLLSSGTYYVAESEDGRVIGCGGWTREHPGGETAVEGVGHIRHFGTHPDWTRKGIGRAIFRRCEEGARASGIREFECYSSINAECFYSALGFERIGVFDIQMGPDVSLTSCHMRYRF
jgi:N-acetylglutamate synthase-like GNAT family acetyltransferase